MKYAVIAILVALAIIKNVWFPVQTVEPGPARFNRLGIPDLPDDIEDEAEAMDMTYEEAVEEWEKH